MGGYILYETNIRGLTLVPSGAISIVIADDHPIFRKGLREILAEERNFHIVADCADGQDAIESIRELKPRAAVLDLEMPKLSGLDVAALVQREGLPTALIMLTIADRLEIFNKAMDLGVLGYLLKDSAAIDLVRGIETILRGEYFISPQLAGRALKDRRAQDGGSDVRLGLSELTPMERKVFRLIAENKTSVDIARELHISPRTVDTHRSNMKTKLGLNGSFALVRFALQHKEII